LEFVVDPGAGPGTAWLSDMRAHGFLDVIGPLGTPFSYPKRLTNCLLIGEGRSVAGLYFLAQELVARGKRVDMVIGGSTLDAVFKPIEAKRLSQLVTVVTGDGTLGETGTVIAAIEPALERAPIEVVYAAGKVPLLSAVAEICRSRKLPAQVAVEERMGCGYGLCGTCAVPVASKDGTTWGHVRACVDGPVFNPARVVWDRWRAAGAASPVGEDAQ
jgi:dihydroorotate dehydrogenase electron transfer subunit